MKPLAIGLLSGLAMLAFAANPARAAESRITFADAPPIQLSASQLVVEESAQAPPGLGGEFSPPPSEIARVWSKTRLVLSGTGGTVRVRILEASLVEEALPTTAGLSGYVTSDNPRMLVMRLVAELVSADGTSVRASASAERRIDQAQSTGAIGPYYDALLTDLARKFDRAMTAQARTLSVGF